MTSGDRASKLDPLLIPPLQIELWASSSSRAPNLVGSGLRSVPAWPYRFSLTGLHSSDPVPFAHAAPQTAPHSCQQAMNVSTFNDHMTLTSFFAFPQSLTSERNNLAAQS